MSQIELDISIKHGNNRMPKRDKNTLFQSIFSPNIDNFEKIRAITSWMYSNLIFENNLSSPIIPHAEKDYPKTKFKDQLTKKEIEISIKNKVSEETVKSKGQGHQPKREQSKRGEKENRKVEEAIKARKTDVENIKAKQTNVDNTKKNTKSKIGSFKDTKERSKGIPIPRNSKLNSGEITNRKTEKEGGILTKCELSEEMLRSRAKEEEGKSYQREKELLGIDFSSVDERGINCPASETKSCEKLAKYLIKECADDLQKARSFWIWITENISYYNADKEEEEGKETKDSSKGEEAKEGMKTEERKQQRSTAEEVLEWRKGKCAGYAALFKKLCDIANVESLNIGGWIKNHDLKPQGIEAEELCQHKNSHCWNAIKYKEKWLLIDCTWGAGYAKDNKFHKVRKEQYWLIPPQVLIHSHYPEKSEWQMLDTPLSKLQFVNSPIIKPLCFQLGLRCLSHMDNSLITAENGKLIIYILSTKPGVRLSAALLDSQDIVCENATLVTYNNTIFNISVLLPEAKTYKLNVFGKEQDCEGEANQIIEFVIESKATLGKEYIFPKIYPIIEKYEVALISHELGYIITKDGKGLIKLTKPSDTKLIAKLFYKEKALEDCVRVVQKSKAALVYFHTPFPQIFKLSLYAKKKTDPDELLYINIINLKIESLKGIMNFPKIFPPFDQLNMQLIYPQGGKITTKNGQSKVTLGFKGSVYFTANLWDQEKKEKFNNFTKIIKHKSDIEILVNTPKAGKFYLEIYGSAVAEARTYSCIVEFTIKSSAEAYPFPIIYPELDKLNLQILEPREGVIQAEGGIARILLGGSKTMSNVDIMATLKREGSENMENRDNMENMDEIADMDDINDINDIKKKDIQQATRIFYNSKDIVILVHTPSRGRFHLKLFGKEKSASGVLKGIATFTLESNGTASIFPRIYRGLDELHIKLLEPEKGRIEAREGRVRVKLGCPVGVELMAHLRAEGEEENIGNATFIRKNSMNIHEILAHTPCPGVFTLLIYGQKRPSKDLFYSLLTFQIESTHTAKLFPRLYDTKDCQLISPMEAILIQGRQYEFKLHSNLALDVALQVANLPWIKFEKGKNNLWVLKYTTTVKGDAQGESLVKINVNYGGKNSSLWNYVCDYAIQ